MSDEEELRRGRVEIGWKEYEAREDAKCFGTLSSSFDIGWASGVLWAQAEIAKALDMQTEEARNARLNTSTMILEGVASGIRGEEWKR